ncbi:MAG: hypothetical protein GY861_15785 [bacterium]|nr:hypothetical protein [bacterium]
MKKRGYFFTIDAFIAMGVMVIGLMLVLFSHTYTPYQEQTTVLANSNLKDLSVPTIKEVNANSGYMSELNTLIRNGNITQMDNTILEQAIEFCLTGREENASVIVGEVWTSVEQEQYGTSLWIDGLLIFDTATENPDSKFLASSKMFVIGYNATHTWGPINVEVRAWQK